MLKVAKGGCALIIGEFEASILNAVEWESKLVGRRIEEEEVDEVGIEEDSESSLLETEALWR